MQPIINADAIHNDLHNLSASDLQRMCILFSRKYDVLVLQGSVDGVVAVQRRLQLGSSFV